MGKIFSISDTWFNRPFGDKSQLTSEEYNNEIIDKWNKTVNKSDDVYVLGGFGVADLYHIVIKLNGTIHLLNNSYTDDEKLFIDNLKVGITNSIDKKIQSKVIFENGQIMSLNDDDVILSYFPLKDWYGKSSGTFCFHGFTEESNFNEYYISCMASKNDFKPINIRDVKNKIEEYSVTII